jgi:hypothetical protein
MSKRKNPSFTPTPDWLRTWVEDKDRIYWNPHKHARGIQSYSFALKSLEDYFKAIKIGSLKPNQRSIAYFAKVWGWNWTKTLRFFVHVMDTLENLDANFYLQRLKKKAEEYAEKAKAYVYKARGKQYQGKSNSNSARSDEDEIEAAFLDAMAQLAKSNPAFYREKVKQNLRAGDKATLENFEAFKAEKILEAEQRRKEEFTSKASEYCRQYNKDNPENKITKIEVAEDFSSLKVTMENGKSKLMDNQSIKLIGERL